jgi:hypothetical protein
MFLAWAPYIYRFTEARQPVEHKYLLIRESASVFDLYNHYTTIFLSYKIRPATPKYLPAGLLKA